MLAWAFGFFVFSSILSNIWWWVEFARAFYAFGGGAWTSTYPESASIWTLANRVFPRPLSLMVAAGISICCIVVTVSGLDWRESRKWPAFGNVSLLIVCILIVTPITYLHYLVLLLIPLAYTIGITQRLKAPPPLFWGNGLVSAMIVVLLVDFQAISWKMFAGTSLLSSWHTLALFLFLLMLKWLASREHIHTKAFK